ncbi:MAG: HEAT repeat domain-containing protein [Bacillota bacterium]
MIVVTYVYFFICLLIMLFTAGYIMYQYYRRRTFKKRVGRFKQTIDKQLKEIHQHRPLKEQQRAYLINQLKHMNHLTAFHEALLSYQNHEDITDYKRAIEPVIKQLVSHYEKRDDMEKAYLSYVIASHASGVWQDEVIYRTLFHYLDEPNVYLRENVLKALYQQNNPEWIVKAYETLSSQQIDHHEKLIQDGLMRYPYDKRLLMTQLYEKRHLFSESILLGVIGFITYETKDYQQAFYNWLKEKKLPLEVELKLYRYFKKYPTEQVKSHLLAALEAPQDEKRIVAADVLAEYCCDDVIQALKTAVSDPNWFVRRNASRSLLKTDVTIDDLMGILTGHDRYARNMLKYYLETEGG